MLDDAATRPGAAPEEPAQDPDRDPEHEASPAWRLELRRALLEVCVLDEVDLVPTETGLSLLTPDGPRELSARRAALVVGDRRAGDPELRVRLRSWLRCHAHVSAAHLRTSELRPLALGRGHALHPGGGWVRERVPGGVLDVGLGVVGVPGEAGAAPLWPDVVEAVAAATPVSTASEQEPPDTDAAWRASRLHLDAMGLLAARRVERALRARLAQDAGAARSGGPDGGSDSGSDGVPDGGAADGPGPELTVIDPAGGCDAVTLLASAPLRRWLARADGTGLRAVAVPTRARGWTDLARTDSTFVAAAWTATDPDRRGLQRPALVTDEEVVLAPHWLR